MKNNTENINNFPSNDGFAKYLNQLTKINTDFMAMPIVGKIVSTDGEFIEVRKKDGRIITIRKTSIKAVEPMVVA